MQKYISPFGVEGARSLQSFPLPEPKLHSGISGIPEVSGVEPALGAGAPFLQKYENYFQHEIYKYGDDGEFGTEGRPMKNEIYSISGLKY